MLFLLSWRNIWRNRQRTLITTASVFFAVILSVVMSSIQQGAFENLIKNVVSFHSGYIQIHKAGYWDEQLLDNSFMVSEQLEENIRKTEFVNRTLKRLETFALAASDEITKGALVVGTEPEEEHSLTSLRNKLTEGEYFRADDKEVLLSSGLAENLKLKTGDTLIILGQGYRSSTAASKYRIKGIVRHGSPQLNNRLVYIPLKEAQNLFNAPDIVTSIVVSIERPDRINDIAASIKESLDDNYEVMTWREMMPDIVQYMQADRAGYYIMIGVLYLVIAFGIFGTILMMTSEREYEFGTLVAIGMKKSRLSFVLLFETLYISSLGTIAGMAASVPIVYYLSEHPISFSGNLAETYEKWGFEAIMPASTSVHNFYEQGMIVLILTVLISLYFIFKIARLKPVISMRK